MKQGWEIKKLGEVCDILDSQRKPVTKKDRKEGQYPYYGATGIQDYVDSYIFDGRYLLLGEDGAKWGAMDKSAFIIEGKCWVNNHAHILKVHDCLIDTFAEYYLVFKDLDEYITGAIVRKLTQQALRDIPILIPPIAEQEKIVAELDCLSGIIEKKKQQLKELDNLAQSIFYEMFGDPVENDKGWEVKKLGEVCDVRDGTHDSPKYLEHSEYVLVTSKNITSDGDIDFTTANYISKEDYDAINKRSYVDFGDIIMAMIGTIGKPIIVKETSRKFCIKNVALIKFEESTSVTNTYIQALLSNDSYASYIQGNNKGGTQKFIALGTIRKLLTPIPPLTLQQAFASKIESIEKQKELIAQSIKEAETLFNSRMDYYFN